MTPEFYGDESRWFIATVIDGSPPTGFEGSVRIRIHGIHSGNVNDIPHVDLPWAQVVIPGTEGGVSGMGGACRLLPGAQVFGMFMDGRNSQVPLVLGSIAKTEYPSTVQAQLRDDPTTNLYAYDIRSQRTQAVYPETIDTTASNVGFEGQAVAAAMKFFIDNGYSAPQAAGIVGNIEAVSGYKPDLVQNNSYGLMQWSLTGNRFANLKLYARRVRPDRSWSNFEIQLLFILQELRSTMTAAQSKLLASTTVTDPQKPGIRGSGSAAAIARYYLPIQARQITSLNRIENAAENALDEAYR